MCVIRSGCRRCHKSSCGLLRGGGGSLYVHILHTCTFLMSATEDRHSLRASADSGVHKKHSHTHKCAIVESVANTHMQHTWQQMTTNHRSPSGMNPNNEFPVLHGLRVYTQKSLQFQCDSTIYNDQLFWISLNFKI